MVLESAGELLPSIDGLGRVVAAVEAVGEPCAVSGVALAALRGWLDFTIPPVTELVVPATRTNVYSPLAKVRRVVHWNALEVVAGACGMPWLGILDGVLTVAPHVDEGDLHLLLQRLSYEGALDVPALMRRRRTGLPGSAKISRVGGFYLLGLDSPREVEVFNVLRSVGYPPDHLNVMVVSPDGRSVGPIDGYADVGAGYEVDSIFHLSDDQRAVDRRKSDAADAIGMKLVRFLGTDITTRRPMIEGWIDALDRATSAAAGAGLVVVHLPGRSCPCGHIAE